MTLSAGPTFSESLTIAADRQRLQRWQAARTVRAHFTAGEERDDVLACLGLTEAGSDGPPDAAVRLT